jgi:L-amino acid N-acyltransferase YncA
VTIRRAATDDAAALAALYAPYVTDSVISFETVPPDAAEMRRRIEACGDDFPWLVACEPDGSLLGYAYASPFRTRPAYRFAVETSAYVDARAHRRGIGRSLYDALLRLVEAQGYTQAIAAITLPNPASVALHEALGFMKVGTYGDVGFKAGGWHSVGLWQRALAPATPDPAAPLAVSALWPDQRR